MGIFGATPALGRTQGSGLVLTLHRGRTTDHQPVRWHTRASGLKSFVITRVWNTLFPPPPTSHPQGSLGRPPMEPWWWGQHSQQE